jgi:uncharacterized membrane protein
MPTPEFRTGVIRPIEVYKEAWAIMKDQFWLIFAITLVGMLIGSFVPIVLVGPMMCGIYMCLLDKIDGRPLVFDRLLKGFDHFLSGLIVALVIMVPMVVFIVAIYIPMIAMAFAGNAVSEDMLLPVIIGIIIMELVVGIVMMILHSLIVFSFLLIVDRGLNGFEAVKLSARAVWANRGGVAGLFGVGILVAMVGYLALCVGVYLALPVLLMAMAVAYRKVFPATEPLRFDPPPPDAYHGL